MFTLRSTTLPLRATELTGAQVARPVWAILLHLQWVVRYPETIMLLLSLVVEICRPLLQSSTVSTRQGLSAAADHRHWQTLTSLVVTCRVMHRWDLSIRIVLGLATCVSNSVMVRVVALRLEDLRVLVSTEVHPCLPGMTQRTTVPRPLHQDVAIRNQALPLKATLRTLLDLRTPDSGTMKNGSAVVAIPVTHAILESRACHRTTLAGRRLGPAIATLETPVGRWAAATRAISNDRLTASIGLRMVAPWVIRLESALMISVTLVIFVTPAILAWVTLRTSECLLDGIVTGPHRQSCARHLTCVHQALRLRQVRGRAGVEELLRKRMTSESRPRRRDVWTPRVVAVA